MNFEDLTPEQQAKARACKTVDDILALAREEGYELSEEELEAVAAGVHWCGCNSWGKPCGDYDPTRCGKNMGV